MRNTPTVRHLHHVLSALILLSSASVADDSATKWKEQDAAVQGDLQAMLRAVEAATALPQWRTTRTADELIAILQKVGRFRDLGLSDAEGATLVRAVYAKHQPRAVRPKANLKQLLSERTDAKLPFTARAGTEFETLEGILLRWPFDWSALQDEYAVMVAAFLRGGATPFIWVDTERQRQAASDYLVEQGVAVEEIEWIVENTDSVWIRDYGPQFLVATEGTERAIVDFHYYDSRPVDDAIPAYWADVLGVPRVNRQSVRVVYTEGGNLNYDGLGTVTYSTRTYQANSVPKFLVDLRILTGVQANEGLVLQDPSLDGTGHVDMFTKIVNESTVLVGEYVDDQVDYEVLEQAAEDYAAATNGAGNPWTVVRIPQPDVYYAYFVLPVVRTYTNAQLANGTVVVPVYGLPTDEEALAIYAAQFPDREIVPLDANDIIEAAGAWHCVCMEMPAGGPPDEPTETDTEERSPSRNRRAR